MVQVHHNSHLTVKIIKSFLLHWVLQLYSIKHLNGNELLLAFSLVNGLLHHSLLPFPNLSQDLVLVDKLLPIVFNRLHTCSDTHMTPLTVYYSPCLILD
jgi:hypothetical protein